MSADADTTEDPEPAESGRNRRRVGPLLLVVFLVVAGGGFGTFVLDEESEESPGPATPTEGPTPSLRPPDPTTPTADGTVSFEFVDNATLVRAGNVVPGDSGATRRAVRNTGSMTATLAVVDLSITDDEGGLTDPETEVDDSPNEGELSEHLLVRLTMTDADGETATVFGGEGFVTLADLRASNESVGPAIDPGTTTTLTFEYRISEAAGNEIQSDTVDFDVEFQLRAPETENSSASPRGRGQANANRMFRLDAVV